MSRLFHRSARSDLFQWLSGLITLLRTLGDAHQGGTMFVIDQIVPTVCAAGAGTAVHLIETAEFAPQPTPPELLPDPVRATAQVAQGIVDVLSGLRPIGQLNQYTSDEVRELLRSRQKVRAIDRRGHRLPKVVSIRVTTPHASVIEASAIVGGAPRARALALRLEGLDGRWQCTALEMG